MFLELAKAMLAYSVEKPKSDQQSMIYKSSSPTLGNMVLYLDSTAEWLGLVALHMKLTRVVDRHEKARGQSAQMACWRR